MHQLNAHAEADAQISGNCCFPAMLCIFTPSDSLLGVGDSRSALGGRLKERHQQFVVWYSGHLSITGAKRNEFFIDFFLMEVGLHMSGMNAVCVILLCFLFFSFMFALSRFCLACICRLTLAFGDLYHSSNAMDPPAEDTHRLRKV